MTIQVKICGLTTEDHVKAACDAGAAFVGLVFFPKSPRHVSIGAAAKLAAATAPGVSRVALMVNPTDDEISAVLADVDIDVLQLHGGETLERVREVRERFHRRVMKAVGVSDRADIERANTYAKVADMVLVDAKAPKGTTLPGGNGVMFDWGLLDGFSPGVPWMLAGGLTPETAGEAAGRTGAPILDVSSGVESAPGQKDPNLMRAFVRAAQGSVTA